MNKEDIIEQYKFFLKAYCLEPNELVLGAGGAMVMHGLRETTSDMDMSISNDLSDDIANTGDYPIHEFMGVNVISWNDYIDLHQWGEKETVIIDGVCCWIIPEIFKFKLEMNRDKDQQDIAILQRVIGLEYLMARAKVHHQPKLVTKERDSVHASRDAPITIPVGITRQKQDFAKITISRTQANWLAHYLPFLISDTLSIPSPEPEVVEALENVLRQLTSVVPDELDIEEEDDENEYGPGEAKLDDAGNPHFGYSFL